MPAGGSARLFQRCVAVNEPEDSVLAIRFFRPKIVNCNLEMGSINQINIIFFWKTACFRILPISVVVFLATWLTHHTLVLQHIILHCLHCPGSAERKLTLD